MLRIEGQGAPALRPPNLFALSDTTRGLRASRALATTAAVAMAAALGGCASSSGSLSGAANLSPSKKSASGGPMFPESKWGVSASRRVAGPNERIPKGGGTYKVGSAYQVGGRWYQPREQPDYDRVGVASWYGSDFHGRKTANGEIFDMHALTAAHPTLPMPSYAYVTNISNNRTILVRINDRGPYVGDRMIDLSRASADTLGLRNGGLGRVRVRYAGPAPLDGDDTRERQYLASRAWSRGSADIAAVERAVSQHEWASHQPEPRSPAPQTFAQRSDWPEAYDRRQPPAPSRSYASASYAPGAWSPYSYRAGQAR